MDVKVYDYNTRDVYEWGLGFVSHSKQDTWQKFWDSIADTKMLLGEELYFWRVMKPSNDSGCYMLVTTGGAIYVHPMNGKGVIRSLNYAEHDGVYEEAKRIFKTCAKTVGCCINISLTKGVVNYE